MNFKQLNEILSYIDLVPGEVKVYLALLQKRNCSPAEAAKISGLNRTNVYDLLISLEEKGACVLLQSSQKIYEPVDPNLLIAKLEKRLSLITADITEVSEQLNKLYDNPYDTGDAIDYMEVMSNPILILKKFNDLIELSEKEILISSTGDSIAGKLEKKDRELAYLLDEDSNRLIDKALQRGVLVNVIIGLNDLNESIIDELNLKMLEYENYDIRVIKNISCKLALFDGEHIAIGLRGIRTGKFVINTIYLKDKGLGNYQRKAFYSYWEEGVSIKDIDIDVLVNEGRIKK